VPQRNKNGVAGSGRTNIVYTVDAVRGLDVYTVDLPGTASATPLLGSLAGGPDPAVTVLALALVGLTGLATLRRRRLAPARVHS
jgi:MYXO-CTERM domain-containing protein